MPISQMRKQRLNIWPVCAAAGREGSSHPAAISFHSLSTMGRWCGKLPRSTGKAYALEGLLWERALQAEAGVGTGMVCVGNSE